MIRQDNVRRVCALVAASLASACAATGFAARAGAVDAQKPFAIQSFTMQTTIPTEAPEQRAQGEQAGYKIVNRPYSFTQAGGHPIALTTTIRFATEAANGEAGAAPTQDPKDIVVNLPPGLLGDPQAAPECSIAHVTGEKKTPCLPATQVGQARLVFAGSDKESVGPIYNVTPEAGQSAEFALTTREVDTLLTAHLVREEGGYGITVVTNEIPGIKLTEAEVTFWGVPAEERFDPLRGLSCSTPDSAESQCHHNGVFTTGGNEAAGILPVAFLSMPTDCSEGAGAATVRADSWEHPGHVVEGRYENYVESTYTMPPVTGCNLLQFNPLVEAHPDTALADSPVGLGVNVVVPQSEQPEALATPHLRGASVTLPLGMSISPGIVDGIEACEASGPHGIDFTGPESEEVALDGELQLAPGHCPDASIVGEAEAETPLLASPLKGHVYLARPGCGGGGQAPCTNRDAADGNLYKLYLELGGVGALGNAGVNIKVEGRVHADPATGQLTTTFEENPQTPFSNLHIRLNGGPRSPLDNPASCGPATTTADFEPWSAPGVTPEGVFVPGDGDATPSSTFEVSGCEQPQGFAPQLLSGTVSPEAGSFSSFTMNLARGDREQFIKGIQLKTPPGLLGMLSNVPLCGNAQGDAGTCPEASKIGTVRVASGAGSHPFEIEGRVYLTKAYDGAPFGLSIVTPAVAGPFNLGLVVVRARINVDPTSSALTVTTDETGPYAVPQILDGVPLRLKRITVNIDRPEFMFNPTSCKAQQITATISGSGLAVAQPATPFAAGDCRSLAFTPTFTAQTNGRTSRKRGASLDVRLSFPKGAMGSQANVAKVKVELPKQLPSYLNTLQKACLASIFAEDPADCPSGSIVGIARTRTPVLPVQLSGPVYFVSHGGVKFPSLIVVLQGDGVRVDLEGETFISKKGITSSTFNTVPDVPVDSFELYLPQGENHALAANVNLCTHRKKLVMPTTFWAQNGKTLRQQTKIAVTGCAAKRKRSARTVARQAHATTRRGR